MVNLERKEVALMTDNEKKIEKCPKCGSKEFHSFRVAGSTTTSEHWSLECENCGEIVKRTPVVYIN